MGFSLGHFLDPLGIGIDKGNGGGVAGALDPLGVFSRSGIASSPASGPSPVTQEAGPAAQSTGMTPDKVRAYLDANPEIRDSTAQWLKQSGDHRDVYQWVQDDMNNNPDSAHVDQFNNWAQSNPAQAGGADPGTETVPIEQDLMQRAINDYIYPDLERDAGRRAEAQTILDRYNRSIDDAIKVNQGALDGTRLAAENDAADTEAAGQNRALDTLNSDRLAALAPLNQERLTAADTRVSGINMGLEGERDRINAEDAMSGFVGGSSMKDSALARAAYAARQGGAEEMGNAKVLNATDTRGVLDDTARGHASSEYGRLATRRGYFDNDFTRRLSSSLLPATLEANRFQLLGAADDYGQSGLRRAQSTLNWWQATPQAPNYQTPNVDTFQTQASQAGNSLSQLGAGLANAGFQYAMSKKNNASYGGIPVYNTPDTPSTTNWWAPASVNSRPAAI